MFRPNRLKKMLQTSSQPIGCWIFFSDSDSIELLSMCGFDAFIIDHEHGAMDMSVLVEQLRAAQATDVTCILRVPSHDPVYIKRALDMGVEGILVPTVESADEARAIVAATRYRPHGGHRGIGYLESRAANWGLAALDYPANYRENLLIAVIIETRRGFENVKEIAAVDGIDMVFLGPGDLTADIGDDFPALTKLGDNSELNRLMAEAEAIVLSTSDCWLGGISLNAAGGRALFAKGYDFVTPAADGWMLSDAARSVVTGMRG
ncbi:4-hydroxy-2-oxovalerate aldolase [Tolypothrix sp. LEGE 11397]|uniref:HpcH/HpaI aldolase family protein n=2 Tax=unclassified Tolypothrix TaxID=2649714 RepID=UPI0005EAAA67|nr:MULTISPECIES: aldolase/citrate lyase family protein [unclassified Tolypothrix]EKE96853.1 HpcH/HpaI aldolase/citrate lyase family protein [Tolypothrix sp. PCC 7601]MBE9084472.1 4-hydroxy-2-oxovalerate aldolase [Tolypothrix sp. LEGE 11397]UYD23437.1 4-hydroxy-2-oxovalerate aldolase [Tolypothrix sp. PCC 7712]UYD34332.1 4-hydroxy-2-oxovalerate aldolase [Tolypothrix sp. PCC 7601]